MKQHTQRAVLVAILGAAPALSMAAGEIKFNGMVKDQTCTVTVNGGQNVTVTLPTVSAAQLANAGDNAGTTGFIIKVEGCNASGTAFAVNTIFWGGNPTQEGDLPNTAAGGATNVALQLLKSPTSSDVINLATATPVDGMMVPAGGTSAQHEFGVRYISRAGGATPGAVTSTVNYDISYQ